jgi:hypothetical protein
VGGLFVTQRIQIFFFSNEERLRTTKKTVGCVFFLSSRTQHVTVLLNERTNTSKRGERRATSDDGERKRMTTAERTMRDGTIVSERRRPAINSISVERSAIKRRRPAINSAEQPAINAVERPAINTAERTNITELKVKKG